MGTAGLLGLWGKVGVIASRIPGLSKMARCWRSWASVSKCLTQVQKLRLSNGLMENIDHRRRMEEPATSLSKGLVRTFGCALLILHAFSSRLLCLFQDGKQTACSCPAQGRIQFAHYLPTQKKQDHRSEITEASHGAIRIQELRLLGKE